MTSAPPQKNKSPRLWFETAYVRGKGVQGVNKQQSRGDVFLSIHLLQLSMSLQNVYMIRLLDNGLGIFRHFPRK